MNHDSNGFNFEKTPNSIGIWTLMRLNNDLPKIILHDEPLPNLYGGRLSPSFTNPLQRDIKPALLYVMQGINSTRKGYEFFTDASDVRAIHVSRHGDYMGAIHIASGVDSTGFDAVVITSKNIFRSRKPAGLEHNQIFTKDLDRGIQKALDFFLPFSDVQRRDIARGVSYLAFMREKALYVDPTSVTSMVSNFVKSQKDSNPIQTVCDMVYFFLKANTPKAEDSWADDTVDTDFTKETFEYLHGFDIPKYIQTVERFKENRRREQLPLRKGNFLQINKAGTAYLTTSKSVLEENLRSQMYLSVAQIPNAYYEDYSVLKAAGVGNYVNGIGVQLAENRWDEHYSFINNLFYLEREG